MKKYRESEHKMASKSKKNMQRNVTNYSVNDTVVNGVSGMLVRNSTAWHGTMTDLKSDLTSYLGKRANLPKSSSALRVVINKVINRLRSRGITVRFGRTTDHTRTRYVTLTH